MHLSDWSFALLLTVWINLISNLKFSLTYTNVDIFVSIYFNKCDSQLKRLEIKNRINHSTFFLGLSEIEIFHLKWFFRRENEWICRHRNSTPGRSGMNTCIFGCATGFCIQMRVCVTPAERVVTAFARWDDDDDVRLTYCERIATFGSGANVWRTKSAEPRTTAGYYRRARTLNEEVPPWDRFQSRYARREGCRVAARRWTAHRSPAPDQIPWIARRFSHTDDVVVSGPRHWGGIFGCSEPPPRHTRKTNTATAILRHRTISCATDHARKQHEDCANHRYTQSVLLLFFFF